MPEEIIIKIKREPLSGEKPARRRRAGVIRASSEEDYLPRRAKNEVLVNFYDLGQIKNTQGEWIDLPFTASTGYVYDQNNQISYDDFRIVHWNALRDLIFEIPVAEWKDNYRKLGFEAAERYGLDLLAGGKQLAAARNNSRKKIDSQQIVTDTKWTETGLKVPIGSGLKTLAYSSFYRFDTGDAAAVKVTPLPSYSAGPVSFSLSKPSDVFLVPQIQAVTGGVNNNQNQPLQSLLVQHSIVYRTQFLEAADFTAATGNLSIFTMPTSFALIAATAFRATLLEFLKSRPLVEAYDQVTGDFIPTAAFPVNDNYQIGFTNLGGGGVVSPLGGTLLAVVSQGNDWFYVWATDAFPVYLTLFLIGRQS